MMVDVTPSILEFAMFSILHATALQHNTAFRHFALLSLLLDRSGLECGVPAACLAP